MSQGDPGVVGAVGTAAGSGGRVAVSGSASDCGAARSIARDAA